MADAAIHITGTGAHSPRPNIEGRLIRALAEGVPGVSRVADEMMAAY